MHVEEGRRTAKPEQMRSERSAPAHACIRPMRMDDLGGVMAIECASFDRPYEPAYFIKALQKTRVSIAIASLDEEPVAAYAAFWVDGGKREAQVISLAVSPHCRRRGLAESLLDHIKSSARARGARRLTLHVSVLNQAAQDLYRKHGFRFEKWLKDYYGEAPKGGVGEDGMLMCAQL